MGRRLIDSGITRRSRLVFLLAGFIAFFVVYLYVFVGVRRRNTGHSGDDLRKEDLESEDGVCCRGIEHLELWGEAVKWGSDHRLPSPEACCLACKDMCKGKDGPCSCDSWVYCSHKGDCGPRFGECWLKKQKDVLDPQKRESGDRVMWTSGLIFGKEEGVVGLETKYGILRIRLFPDCAPHSVSYILELLALHYCAGCYFYRAESRGDQWDSAGNHIEDASFGPPYALIQGTLESHGALFEKMPREHCPPVKRGSVAWIDSGPEFFISLANHNEWRKPYTVFGQVLPADMEIAEKVAQLPTKRETWSNISVSALENFVPIRFQRTTTGGKR